MSEPVGTRISWVDPRYSGDRWRRAEQLPRPDLDAYVDHANRTLNPPTPYGYVSTKAQLHPGMPDEAWDAVTRGLVRYLYEKAAEAGRSVVSRPRFWCWRKVNQGFSAFEMIDVLAAALTAPLIEVPEPDRESDD